MTDPASLGAAEAARRIRPGSLTAEALMQACLDRVAAREDTVHAFVHLDAGAALTAARAADARVAAGHSLPLLGVPIGVKDVIDVAGMPCAYGSPIWQGHRPMADAACVALARAAGAVVMGKTVSTEFATQKPGPTTNPHNPAHTPGGSSSGSAAGVAAGFFPAAFATQTGGSIIRPAAFCGVVGYMPSHGMLHRAGMKVMSESLDTIGAIARSVADCALLVGACAGRDFGALEGRLPRPLRIAVTLGPTPDLATPDTVALIARAARAAADAGVEVVQIDLPRELLAAYAAHPIVMNAESAQAIAWELTTRRDQVSDMLIARVDGPDRASPQALDDAREVLRRARVVFTELMSGFDAVLTPSAPGEAPHSLASTGNPAFNALWTALHAACVTVPAGSGQAGLPLGVQLVAPHRKDQAALACAAWFQGVL